MARDWRKILKKFNIIRHFFRSYILGGPIAAEYKNGGTEMSSREQERRAAAAKWERLTLANDRMFGMVMEDEQICLQLLQQIFPELKIKSIQRVATQKQVNTTLGVKSPRFDVYLQDDQNRIYILEMQVKNNHNLPFRMRYYLNHADILKPGDKYDEQQDRKSVV